ncbi:MAG: hypothetical protein ACKOSO_00475 [Actinomycetota bacterium]
MHADAIPGVIADVAELEAVYGPPVEAVQQKAIDHLDEHSRRIIGLSPFVPGELLKLYLAAALLPGAWRLMARLRG